MNCIIYLITNSINDKVYVGQTYKSLVKRFKEHCQPSKVACIKLHNALKKHGIDKFQINLITIAHTQEVADYWEKYFIENFDSINNGYNVKFGGLGGRHSEEVKLKLSGENNGRAKLTKKDILFIRKSNLSQRELANKFLVSRRTIRDILSYKIWKHSEIA